MMSFLSSFDALFAATVVAATIGVGVLAFLLAKSQRPAGRVVEPEAETVAVTTAHAAEAHGQRAAA